MVESTWLDWEDLGSSTMCYLIVIILIMCMIMLSDNKILELSELSQNMNLLNGYALIWHWYGMSSNLGGTKVNFLFAKISFGLNVKGQRKS